jgi:2-hydroxycyclohexanecarboxyl-CoA dehydrogenase
MGQLDSKIAIVTGAARGLGRGIAEKLASHGATVVLTDLNEDGVKQAAQEIGGSAVGIGCDVTSWDSVEAMVSAVKDRFGRIDVLVNNAGWDKAAPFLDLERELWDKIIAINLGGVLNTSKAVLPIMAEQGSGSVINISSDAGRVGSSGEAVYSAAKGGVIAFTKSMAREMARKQVRVNVVCPGPSDTQLFAEFAGDNQGLRDALTKAIPLRRLGQPEDVAGAVAYFASDDAAYVTGQTVSVSGGLTMS